MFAPSLKTEATVKILLVTEEGDFVYHKVTAPYFNPRLGSNPGFWGKVVIFVDERGSF